ncbi:MAG: DUF2163 domain-containing protein [Gammaproteobacteria bacterium]|nr:DUF2163 domain-containing protein [Gammaproteobacteria bacterium]
MRTIAAPLLAHAQLDQTTLAMCWRVERADGGFILGTTHDRDLEISSGDLAGTYRAATAISGSDVRSTSDMSVDNMEVRGALDQAGPGTDVTVADVEAGLLDAAPAQTFLVNWQAPDNGQVITRRGYLGEISRDAEGNYRTELRGLMQLLQQNIGRTYGERCDVKRFGDARCGLDVDALIVPGTVSAVASRRRFNVAYNLAGTGLVSGDHKLGEITFTSGANSGYTRQIKRDVIDAVSGAIELWESMPLDVVIGDDVTLRPGCNRTWEACVRWDNTLNFRGHGRWIPGIPAIIRAP